MYGRTRRDRDACSVSVVTNSLLLKRFRLRDSFEEFDEPYARVSARGFRRVIVGRIAPRLLPSR